MILASEIHNPLPVFVVFLILVRELNTGAQYSHTTLLVLFWIVANTGIAYMQSGINRIISKQIG